jgi:hypothetical protein
MLYRVSFAVAQPITWAGEFVPFEEFAQRFCNINARGVYRREATIDGVVCQVRDFEIPQSRAGIFVAMCRGVRAVIRCERAAPVEEDTVITLLSTVVAPAFSAGALVITPVYADQLPGFLRGVTRNLCGHPVTVGVLKELCPTLPEAERGFWDGSTVGLAVRPRGGVRGAGQTGDTLVTLGDLEAVLVEWKPEVRHDAI